VDAADLGARFVCAAGSPELSVSARAAPRLVRARGAPTAGVVGSAELSTGVSAIGVPVTAGCAGSLAAASSLPVLTAWAGVPSAMSAAVTVADVAAEPTKMRKRPAE
jgi:hypothetical protein